MRRIKKKKSEKEKRKIRLQVIFGVVMVLLSLCIYRIFVIQILDGRNYKKMAEEQHQYKINHMSSRGTIYDRNMVPLTNVDDTVLLFVDNQISYDENMNDILSFAEEGSDILGTIGGTRYKILKVSNTDREAMSNIFNNCPAYPFQVYNRYYEKQPAAHIIGYVNQWDNSGATGLEKSFEDLLNVSQPKIYAMVDGANNIIPGLGIRVEGSNKNGWIVTTLDIDLQNEVEKILESYDMRGSVVVLDTKNGDVLACANYPSYNPNNISEYLKSENEEFFNRAVQVGYPPGSIYKIIVAAAALESGATDEEEYFDCIGYEEINGIRIRCSSYEKGGHGRLSLMESFSKSCNSAFIQLGIKTGSDKILEMSKEFGLGEKTGIPIEEEYEGNLPERGEVKGAGIGNLSVGQGELLITPLQAARATAIIANDGIDKGIRLVEKIGKPNGEIERLFGTQYERVISRTTAAIITEMMEETVRSGTANNLGRIFLWDAAGKTGSAQSIYNNKEVVHGWFTGFLPAESPRYVITVFAEDGKSGRQSATPVFKDIAEYLYKQDLKTFSEECEYE